MAVDPIVPRDLLGHALDYAARGIPVFPLRARDKHPLTEHGFKDATTDEAQIRAWWRKWKGANIGIPTGRASGWLVVDLDTKAGATYDTLLALVPKGHKLSPTLTAHTGSGGLHLIWRYPTSGPDVRNSAGKLAPGIDVRGEGGYIVAAPSVHPSGNDYEWINDLEPAPCPSWLVQLVRAELEPRQESTPIRRTETPAAAAPSDDGAKWLADALERAGEGNRNDTGFWLACQLRDAGLTETQAEGLIMDYAAAVKHRGDAPYYSREASASLREAYSEPAREPARSQTARPLPAERQRPALRVLHKSDGAAVTQEDAGDFGEAHEARKSYHYTEQGNAERLLDAHGRNVRYCGAFGFCIWDGKHWRVDAEGLTVYKWAQSIVNDLYTQAADLVQAAAGVGDPESEQAKQLSSQASALLDWARKSARHQMYTHMREIIKPYCEVEADTFDADPWLLNVQNGTLDLRTGELHEHRREDYLMRLSPVEWHGLDAKARRFGRFVVEIMLGRRELIRYLQRALGYTMTGDVREQVWHLLHGGGENGKGTLMEAIGDILGDLAGEVEPEYITLSGRPPDPNAPSPVAASLKGKRLVKITETAEGARIDAAKVKKLSGGDTLTGRHLHKGIIRFKPTHKLWIYTNHRPETRETTHAFWRRVRYVPFEYQPARKDDTLADKLRAEYPGILAWLVRGCLEWQRQGLNPPQLVLEATQAYREDMQPLRDFVRERCTLAPTAWAPTPELWASYQDWAKDAHARRMLTKHEFTTALADLGCAPKHARYLGKVVRGWQGIGLGNDDNLDPDPDPDPDQSVDALTPVDGTLGNSVPREGDMRGVTVSTVNVRQRVNTQDTSPKTKRTDCDKVGHVWVLNEKHGLEICYCGAARVPGASA